MTTIGMAIPSIPIRHDLLRRALGSVFKQTRPADDIKIAFDHDHRGAAETRNRAWRGLDTDYVAFLDDDDAFLPEHLELVLACALETDADMVFPWYEVVGGSDPFAETFGKPWDPMNPRQTTITCLWKRSALEMIGGFPLLWPGTDLDGGGNRIGEDMLAVHELNNRGGKIAHLPAKTWHWFHHGKNTSGCGVNW